MAVLQRPRYHNNPMTKKDEFSDLAKDIDRKFKELEEKKKRVSDGIRKIEVREHQKNQEVKVDKIKEQMEQEKFRMKEKLFTASIVFIICQLLLIPICLRYSDSFLGMWIMGTFSICIICFAVIDLGP